MKRSFFWDGKILRFEIELRYKKYMIPGHFSPTDIHKVSAYCNGDMVECREAQDDNIEQVIKDLELKAKKFNPSKRCRMDETVRKLIELGFSL